KRGEWNALRDVGAADRSLITPLIELAPKDFLDWRAEGPGFVFGELTKRVRHLPEVWEGRAAFIDAGLLDPAMRASGNKHPLEVAVDVAERHGSIPIPVLGLRRDEPYLNAVQRVASKGNGLAVRVTMRDLMSPTLRQELADVLSKMPAEHGVDLLVDLGVINAGAPSVQQILDRVGRAGFWRTFTVVSGAFPKDLSEFRPGEHILERSDWTWWRNQVVGIPRPARLPAFGDYTTQHGRFSEPPPRANFSASIRYTSGDHWVIMRGEGVFTDGGPGFAQWPANAMMLCARSEYCGEKFSEGDAYIHRMAMQTEKTGNAETWLSASINHHLVFSARQVANLIAS
ncbi:MAG: beta family protein, partial [Anaerolineales bacterium]|nr:beta family protein [Anaerolineales bacterium]